MWTWWMLAEVRFGRGNRRDKTVRRNQWHGRDGRLEVGRPFRLGRRVVAEMDLAVRNMMKS